MAGLNQMQIENAKNMQCEKCANETFTQTFVIKTISGLLTENGKDMMAPIPIFSCANCKHVNEIFVKDLKISTTNKSNNSILHTQV